MKEFSLQVIPRYRGSTGGTRMRHVENDDVHSQDGDLGFGKLAFRRSRDDVTLLFYRLLEGEKY